MSCCLTSLGFGRQVGVKSIQLKRLKKLADLTDAAISRGEVYTEFQKEMTTSFTSRSRKKFMTYV